MGTGRLGAAPHSHLHRTLTGMCIVGGMELESAAREDIIKRLRRIEGQVRGLQKMVEADRYCADIMIQISSVNEALRSVGRELMRNHLRHCASAAIKSGGEEADAMYDELIDLIYKSGR